MAGTGYHNDQFFNLGAAAEPGSAQKVDGQSTFVPLRADNAIFSYPDNQIRTEDHTGRRNQTLKKGYIRSMLTSNNGAKVSLRKCQFQFNPTTLQQSVSSNTSMLNFLQQDPAQYAQPMPGNVNFSFTLFFDRSLEVNNAKSTVVSNPNVNADLWRDNSPGQVGVLHDLSAFFGVVGQGLNKSQIEYMQGVLQDTVTAEANSSTAEDSVTQGEKALSNIKGFLDINLGNSAFLLPVPVRVVFSSLYIVEGLVTNTTVAFTKFSSTLVPMQCSVTVTMEAKYIGFAKAKTFFTETLAQREQMELEAKQEAAEKKKALIDAFAAACKKVDMQWYAKSGDLYQPSVAVSSVLSTINGKYYLGISIPTAAGADTPIKDEFDSGTGMHVLVRGSYEVYRSSSSLASFRGDLASFVASNDLPVVVNAALQPLSPQCTASSSTEWSNLARAGISSVSFSKEAETGPINNITDWFIVHANVQFDVRVGDGTTVRASSNVWKAFGPGTSWNEKVSLSPVWPKVVVPDTGTPTGSVPADNAGTKPPPPGGSSKVGAPVVSTKPAPKPGVVVRQ